MDGSTSPRRRIARREKPHVMRRMGFSGESCGGRTKEVLSDSEKTLANGGRSRGNDETARLHKGQNGWGKQGGTVRESALLIIRTARGCVPLKGQRSGGGVETRWKSIFSKSNFPKVPMEFLEPWISRQITPRCTTFVCSVQITPRTDETM